MSVILAPYKTKESYRFYPVRSKEIKTPEPVLEIDALIPSDIVEEMKHFFDLFYGIKGGRRLSYLLPEFSEGREDAADSLLLSGMISLLASMGLYTEYDHICAIGSVNREDCYLIAEESSIDCRAALESYKGFLEDKKPGDNLFLYAGSEILQSEHSRLDVIQIMPGANILGECVRIFMDFFLPVPQIKDSIRRLTGIYAGNQMEALAVVGRDEKEFSEMLIQGGLLPLILQNGSVQVLLLEDSELNLDSKRVGEYKTQLRNSHGIEAELIDSLFLLDDEYACTILFSPDPEWSEYDRYLFVFNPSLSVLSHNNNSVMRAGEEGHLSGIVNDLDSLGQKVGILALSADMAERDNYGSIQTGIHRIKEKIVRISNEERPSDG